METPVKTKKVQVLVNKKNKALNTSNEPIIIKKIELKKGAITTMIPSGSDEVINILTMNGKDSKISDSIVKLMTTKPC